VTKFGRRHSHDCPQDRPAGDTAADYPDAGIAGDRSYVDTNSLTDLDTQVYETIATLEYTGQPVTLSQIASTTGLDEQVADETPAALVRRGLLIQRTTSAGPAFEPARRDWSAAPELGKGMPG
jgi:Holliday junction resolvasome RuvABC ATP-dependent DNA helicase subunit